ncbi:MAG: PfkB family carbohydrate kinase [Kiritimatiellia bacterium]|jgi:bifunctional ADP-heptose synthase (sugar kinase/adenylyltransferase)|nr:PfkB family carbohydrate kinase [Kiritimatiellia bacterium]MDP6810013.1 PfkB family carbohydrate kinase [Kiritimatiellia bacterium]MDP7024784.1 PfkB family carbohydrate kinase [Kiritimatiellia bacterium]
MNTELNVDELLNRLASVRVGVVGDFCLDGYWELDGSLSERSVETGLPTRSVRSQRYTLGAAGNVAANLRAMGVVSVSVYGVTGSDPFGRQERELMREQGVGVRGLVEQDENWLTHVFIKPLEDGVEASRIDFGNANRLTDGVARRVLEELAGSCADLDVVIINQQVTGGIHESELFQDELQTLIAANPDKLFLLDSRDMCRRYEGTIRKINACEAMRLMGAEVDPLDPISDDAARAAGVRLAEEWEKPLFVTQGKRGCLVIDGDRADVVPAVPDRSPTDPVGAGDSMVAGIAAALAAGHTPYEAAAFGSLVAGVTVQKLHQTGTATPGEIRAIAQA